MNVYLCSRLVSSIGVCGVGGLSGVVSMNGDLVVSLAE